MRIIAPDRRRVISRPCVPTSRLGSGKAELFPRLPRLTPKSAKYAKLGRRQPTPEDDDEAHMSDSEDSMLRQIKMKVVRRTTDRSGGVCAHPAEEDDDDDEDDGEEEEMSEYASSPDSDRGEVDQLATPKSSRRRHGENMNSDEEGTPKRKRSKSDVDGSKIPGTDGADLSKDVGSKDVDSMSKMLGTEVAGENELDQSSAAEQEQAAASLHDAMAASQVTKSLHVLSSSA